MKIDNSKTLRTEATEIISELGLLEMLEPFGNAQLVGSVALDLVVKPDIDFHLLIGNSDVVSVAESIKDTLIAKGICSEIRLSDYLERNSLKIGIDIIRGQSTEWSIDIWVTSDSSTTGFEETMRIREKLNEENRKIILKLKRFFHSKGQLQDGMSSIIYRAVLDEGISSLQEFQDYLERGRGAD